ncbi:hypothetical protein GJ496_005853 [Pomphorhynchus laevis]|nr:hypothetical protein GJ496_005853 [Pomphorhynchus laevis]
MNHVVTVVTKVVNFIRGRAVNHRQFVEFLKEIESDFYEIPYYTEVRWLSIGKVLDRFQYLLDEIVLFLSIKEKLHDFPELQNKAWLNDFSFSVDIIERKKSDPTKRYVIRGNMVITITTSKTTSSIKQVMPSLDETQTLEVETHVPSRNI